MIHNMEEKFGRYLEEFIAGDVYKHFPSKTIMESDNNLFSLLTMNHHPVHLDIEYCKTHQHGKILVVGPLVFSIAVGLTVSEISGKAIANLGYEKIVHNGPVFIGDTISAQTEILSVRDSKNKEDRGIVHVETKAVNQNNELVLTFQRSVLVLKRKLK
jgi:acyl dehydratase